MQDITSIPEIITQVTTHHVVKDIVIGKSTAAHEFLLFIKPEVFHLSSNTYQQSVLTMVSEKLQEFAVSIDGIAIMSGLHIKAHNIMAKHYGFINVLSCKASQIITTEDRAHMAELAGNDISKMPIYGGHEFLQKYTDVTPIVLDELWFTKKSLRYKSGFYFQTYTYCDETFILVNGFHPNQLAYFENQDARILLLLCHSDTSWKSLKWDMVGATFPEKASKSSIRGTLYAHMQKYGFDSVSIANNGIHMSAGPLEAVFEINNFFGNIIEKNITAETSCMQKISQHLLSPAWFSKTEDMDMYKLLQILT